MPKFIFTKNHLDILNNICNKKKEEDINLNTLKAILNVYYSKYPNQNEQASILKLKKEELRNKIIEVFCKNFDKLKTIATNTAITTGVKSPQNNMTNNIIKLIATCNGNKDNRISYTALVALWNSIFISKKELVSIGENHTFETFYKYMKKICDSYELVKVIITNIKDVKRKENFSRLLNNFYPIINDQQKCKVEYSKSIGKNILDLFMFYNTNNLFYDENKNITTMNPTDAYNFILGKLCNAIGNGNGNGNEPKVGVKTPPKVVKKPIVKPSSSSSISSNKIELKVNAVDTKYVNELKKKITSFENNEYNIKKLEEDIKKDDFVKSAIEAHIKALEYKHQNYTKLDKIDWTGFEQEEKKGFSVNMNEIIKKMITSINEKLKEVKKMTIEDKRYELMNILYNEDNGLVTVKGTSRENIKIGLIKNIYMFFKYPLFFFKGFNNFMITGGAGSGKTKLASVIGYMMNNLGILATQKIAIITKQNLVAEYMGQSAPKTRNLLANSLEGVVFLDEAYTLTPCEKGKADSFAEEAVGELINFIDKFIGCMVLIVAGYKDKMNDCFLKFNEGMSRRFPKVLDLLPYSSNDMYKILEIFLNDSISVSKIFTKKQREFMKSIISSLNDKQVFNNQAGDMLNLSKIIAEDAILFSEKYNNEMIVYSFKKFCIGKNIAIDF